MIRQIINWPLRCIVLLAMAVLGAIPISVVQRLGRGLGRLGWLLLARDRRRACRNLGYLDASLGQRTRRRIARSTFLAMGETVLEAISLSKKSRDHLGSSPVRGGIQVRGLDQFHDAIEDALGAGKGLILISAHIGSWELAGALVGNTVSHENAFVARRYQDQWQQKWVEGIRSRLGTRLIYQDETLLKSIRLLQRGGVLSMLTDLDIHRMEGIHVPFFGQPAHTSTAPARLALHTGAPLLPFFLIRDSHGYHFEMEDLIEAPVLVEDDPEVTDRVTIELSQSIERAIRRHPSQWPWMHDRWRSTPEVVLRRRKRRSRRVVEGEPMEA